MPPLRVLGIDPGFGRTGLGVVDILSGESTYIWHDVIETGKEEEFSDRLQTVRSGLAAAIARFQPACAVVEHLFFQTNVTTAMKVGMARGVVLLALADAQVPLVELTPNQVKQGIAGWGGADKKQVEGMVKRLLKMDEGMAPASRIYDDAYDALALAIVGGFVYRTSRATLRA